MVWALAAGVKISPEENGDCLPDQSHKPQRACLSTEFFSCISAWCWEQLVSFELMGICSCQEAQPFSPWPLAWTWFAFIRSLRGLVNMVLWLLLQDPRTRHRPPPAGVRGAPAVPLQVLGTNTLSASPDSAFRIFVAFLAFPPRGGRSLCLL